MEDLFNAQHPAPTGIQPGTPEFNEEVPTEEEQAQYTQFVNMALGFMSQRPAEIVASMNDKSRPVFELVGEMAVKIGEMVVGSAKASQVEPSPDVVFAAGQEIVEHLMEAADAGGILPFEADDPQYEENQAMAFMHAAKVAGEAFMQGPGYNDQVKDEAGNFIARGVAEEAQGGQL